MIFDSHHRGLKRILRYLGARYRAETREESAQVQGPCADTQNMARRPAVLALLISILLIFTAAPATSQACRFAGKASPELGANAARKAVVCVVNKVRKKRGLKRVRGNVKLTQAASTHSSDMVMRGYFSHSSPGGTTASTRAARSGYLTGARSWAVGETLGVGFGRAAPKRMVRNWLRSPAHRSVILTRGWRHIGVGVAWGTPGNPGSGAATYTADFGFRR